ncbi:MAG: histidine kinase [Acidimicrobiia bacterium]|nr:histidine kinase [Acidimicrobiia bacterium]
MASIVQRFRSGIVREWREIGGLGRLALAGVLAAAGLAIALGFSITSAARGHLLEARAEILEGIVDSLERDIGEPSAAAFDEAVRERLLGGETVRVKVWLPDGTIAYSDEADLIGERFELADPAVAAFGGEIGTQVSDLTEPAHAAHRHLGSLIEFYLPFGHEGGAVTSVFEIEQRTDRLEAALGRIERNVWASIGIGLAVLGAFLGILTLARARDLNRRRKQAEVLVGRLLAAQEDERRRIVGSLHDDVGQPLYRLLYGLEGSKARVDPDHPVRDELDRLAGIVRDVDGTLRAELRILHQGLLADIGLEAAVAELAAAVEAETDLDIDLQSDVPVEPDDVPRGAVFRAAGELLTNVRKHAGASRVELRLRGDPAAVRLEVSDDGIGVDGSPGLGLTTTRERLEAIGGSLTLDRRRGGGTRAVATVPVHVGEPP